MRPRILATTLALTTVCLTLGPTGPTGAAAREGARVVELDVPLVGQERDVWCWAASAEMILRALGEADASQCAQATRRVNDGREAGEGEVDCCVAADAPGCVRNGWPRFEDWGFEVENTKSRCRARFLRRLGIDDDQLAARLLANEHFHDYVKSNASCSISWQELTGEIDAGYPIAFAHRFKSGGGHMMVAVGYVEEASGKRWVIVQDPWPPAPPGEPELGGDKEVVSWAVFLGDADTEHWRDYWRIRRSSP